MARAALLTRRVAGLVDLDQAGRLDGTKVRGHPTGDRLGGLAVVAAGVGQAGVGGDDPQLAAGQVVGTVPVAVGARERDEHPVSALVVVGLQVQHRALAAARVGGQEAGLDAVDRKSTRLNSSHPSISYAVFCLKKKIHTTTNS